MDLKTFSNFIRSHNIRIEEQKVKQLWQILTKYGCDSFEAQNGINRLVSSYYQKKMRQILNNTPFQQQVPHFKVLCRNLLIDFFQIKFIRPKDLLQLIKEKLNQKEHIIIFEQTVKNYGLKEQFPGEQIKLLKMIDQIIYDIRLRNNRINKKCWDQIQQIMEQAEQKYIQNLQNLYLQNITITSSFQLKTTLNKYHVKIKGNNFQRLFDQVSKSKFFQHDINFLEKNSYPKFFDSLRTILNLIIPRFYEKNEHKNNKKLKPNTFQSIRQPLVQQNKVQNDLNQKKKKSFLATQSQNVLKRHSSIASKQEKGLQQNKAIDSIARAVSNGFRKISTSIISKLIPQKKINILILKKQGWNQQKSEQLEKPKQTTKKNPFASKNQIGLTSQSVQVIIIFYTKQMVNEVKIYEKNTNKLISLKSETKKCISFPDSNILFIGFKIQNKKQYYRLELKLNNDNIKGYIDPLSFEQYQNYCVLPIFTMKATNPDFYKLRNQGLFESIRFVLQKIINKQTFMEQQMLVWLKPIFSNYIQNNPQHEDYYQFFSSFIFSKQYPVAHTKFIVYFFYAIYRQRAEQNLKKYKLTQKMIFQNDYKRFEAQRYQSSNKFNNLCQRLYLQNSLNQKNIQQKKICRILKSCIQNQPKQQIFQILYDIVNKEPSILIRIDNAIFKEVKSNKYMNALHYLCLGTKYFLTKIDNNQNQEEVSNIIIKFIDHLIKICLAIPAFQTGQNLIQQQQIENLFYSNKNGPDKAILRVKIQYFPILYRKCKNLQLISKNLINFVKIISPFLSLQYLYNLNNKLITMIQYILLKPINQMDLNLIYLFYRKNNSYQQQLKQMIQIILNQQLPKQSSEQLQRIINLIVKQKYALPLIKYEQMLIYLDEEYRYELKNSAKEDFLTRQFRLFLLKIKFISGQQHPIIQHIPLKQYLDIYFEIKNQKLKNQYFLTIFEQLKSKIKNNHEYILQTFERIYQAKTDDKKRQFWIISFLENQYSNSNSIDIQIWQFLKKRPFGLNFLSTKYGNEYQIACKLILKKIQENDLYADQLNQIENNIPLCRIYIQQLQNIFRKSKENKDLFQNNLKAIIEILKTKQDLFKVDIEQFLCYQKRLKTVRLIQAYNIDQKYQSFFGQSSQIYAIKQYRFWDSEKINCFQDVIEQYKTIKIQVINSLNQFQKNELTYANFHKYFLANNFENILDDNCGQNENLEKMLKQSNVKMKQGYIIKLVQLCQSINHLCEILKIPDVVILFQNLQRYSNKIKNEEYEFKIKELFIEIQLIEMKLSEIFNFKINEQCSESLSSKLAQNQCSNIIVQTYRSKTMFNKINQRNIDIRSIGDLIEYVDDLQNSILKTQTIRQFKNVIRYWQIISKQANFYKILEIIQNQFNSKQIELAKNIKNCFDNFKNIQQKMDEAMNRQTSFKYQIQSIFLYSIIEIKNNLQIIIKIPHKDIIDYKKMNSYKDKSMLLINDISRQQNRDGQQNRDENLENMIQVFKKYDYFFSSVESIREYSHKLLNYGYNPKDLTHQIQIKEGNFQQLINHQKYLVETSENWIAKIKMLYSKSYLLTHFIGSQLNKFIEDCLQQRYPSSLERILQITKESFQDQLQTNSNFKKLLNEAKTSTPIIKVQKIIEAFSNQQKIYVNTQQSNLLEGQTENKIKPIVLVTCSTKEIYCCFFQNQTNKLAKPSQVLYCQQSTNSQQIECFLDRSLIYYKRIHYIVCAHNLKEQIKNVFCDLLSIIQKQKQHLNKYQLCFVDDVMNDKVYAFISSRPKLFHIMKKELSQKEALQKTANMIKRIPSTLIVTSTKAGLGKTFTVQQQTFKSNQKLRYFPLCGNISFSKIAKRLKNMHLTLNDSLLIQIGHVENKKKLEIFLAQIILFRCFYFEEYIFLPQQLTIFIQMENVVNLEPQNYYHIIDILTNYNQIIHIKSFNLEDIYLDPLCYEDKFVYIYLSFIQDKKWIRNNDYSYRQYEKHKKLTTPFPENTLGLIKRYFLDHFQIKKIEPTFIIFKAFKNMLFNAFKTFSDSPYFWVQNFKQIQRQFAVLQLQKSRQNFLQIFISNTLEYLQETITTNDFDMQKQNLKSIGEKIRQFPILIVPSAIQSNYEFIYLNDETVQFPIKSFLLSQNQIYLKKLLSRQTIKSINKIFHQTALNNLDSQKQEQKMFKILYQLSGNKNFNNSLDEIYTNIPDLKTYKLTLDNFFKMCLIIHRSCSFVPCIIMGESGVGKTALIDFLVRVVYNEKIFIYNVHAGIHQQEIQKWVQQFVTFANNQKNQEDNGKGPKRVWVFFDEFNTTDELNYIKQIILQKRFLGEQLPKNIVFLAACNPYRKKQSNFNRYQAGLKKNQQADVNQLAFKVKPPTLSMIQLMWDYQQLGEKQNQSYIQKMLEEIKIQKKQLLIQSIVYAHQQFKRTIQKSTVSLRNVSRFKELYNWFLRYMERNTIFKANTLKQSNYVIHPEERAAILAFTFSYALRFSTSSQRAAFLEAIEIKMGYANGYMKKVLQNEQRQYINYLKLPQQKIALNPALMQNIFSSLVCIMNKIPVLIIGNPGSSKSLSIKMLNSSLRGKSSTNYFCQQFPEINMIYFQGSQSSTSRGVEQVFEKAMNNLYQNKKWNIENCILFDEIGLAEKSIHNPLKVLHSRLETNKKDLAFIGISNWELDAAKMSRFLVISRSNPDENEINFTALAIYKSYFGQDTTHKQRFKILGSNYYKFIKKWDSYSHNREGFFGLRDFYNYIKYVCNQIKKDNNLISIDKAVAKAIQINFDGQKQSLNIFREIAKINKIEKQLIDPIQLVRKNLQDPNSRCLLLIIRGDSLIPIINQDMNIKKQSRKIVCMHGSTFQQDQQSEDYNLQTTSLIISHVSRGNILALKDINNSIQTSLYDLFNKSYTQIGNKKYCRIAVGANSNPKCFVHQNFNAIVYVDESKLKDLDLPFINRFEKHCLNLKSVITPLQINMLNDLVNWLNQLLSFRSQDMILKRQNFIINCCQRSIVTLIIKYRGHTNQIDQIKASLLQNRTTDFTIAIESEIQMNHKNQIKKYIQLSVPILSNKNDLIIFTYDQYFFNLIEEKTIFNNKSYTIRLSQIKNEKQLRKYLKIGLNSIEDNHLEVKLNYQHHYMHINFLLFLTRQMKTTLNSNKQIIIIIQLHRFSLHQLKIQSIQISYLHKFDQYFLEDLQSLEQISDILNFKHMREIYYKLDLEKMIELFYIDALKLIKFKYEFQKIEELKQDYFKQCIYLANNDFFKTENKKIIEQFLKTIPINNFSFIQQNDEDIMCSSNIKEALLKYIGNIVKQIIFYVLRMTIQEGFLFYFSQNRFLDKQKKRCIQYLKDDCLLQKDKLKQLFKNCYQRQCNNLLKNLPQNRKQSKFQKIIETNIIKIRQQITIIPQSFKDFSLFLMDKQVQKGNSLEKLLTQKNQSNDNNMPFEKCKIFIRSNFKISSQGIFDQIRNDKKLQKFYLFDILQFYLKYSNQSDQDICQYLQFFMKVFDQFAIEEKIILLTVDKKLVISIFQLISLFLKQEKYQNLIQKMGQIPKKDYKVALIQFTKFLFKIGAEMVQLPQHTIQQFGGINHYVSFFRSIYIKMNQIRINYQQKGGLIFSNKFVAINQLLQMLQKIKIIDNMNLINSFIKGINRQKSIYFTIYLFSKQLLQYQQLEKQKQIILNFLSLNIFYIWLKQIFKQDSNFVNEKDICIDNFVQMCNQQCFFSNNATNFISMMLPKFQDILQINQMQLYFTSSIHKCYLKERYIDMTSNFSISLGNYISEQIQYIFQQQYKIQCENQDQNGERYIIFTAQTFYQSFTDLLNNFEQQTEIFMLFKIEFVKRYALKYLYLLDRNLQNQLLIDIDKLLCEQNQLMKHVRLYLLKYVYSYYEDFDEIKKLYIERVRCRWIKKFEDLFENKYCQQFIPPKLLPEDHQIYRQMKELQLSKFSNLHIFQNLIQFGLKNPLNTYELLTFFMLKLYRRQCPEFYINRFIQALRKRVDLLNGQNYIVYKLLLCYMNHYISQKYQFKKGTSNYEFSQKLPLLNYLNIVISMRLLTNPFMEMFFNNKGQVQNRFESWINQRYLIGSMQNPCLTRLQFILKRKSQKFIAGSYTNCSRTCDYICPIGGNFYGTNDGCPHPTNSNRCPLCGGVMGADRYNQLINREASVFQPKNIEEMMPIIENRKIVTLRKIDKNFEYNLMGYQNGNTVEKLKQSFEMKKHYTGVATDFLEAESQLIHHKLLQAIINFVWYFMSHSKCISQESLMKIFNYNQENSTKFLLLATDYYFQSVNQSIKFDHQTDYILWHLGMTKPLVNFLQTYNAKVNKDIGQNNLLNTKARDLFTKSFQQLIFPYCQREKERFILQNRSQIVKTVNKTDVIRQLGKIQVELNYYPKLKMFKLLKMQMRPSYNNLNKFYKQTLAKNYPILSYIINNEIISEKLIHFSNIYTFITKIWKIFNLQITREEGKRPLKDMMMEFLKTNELEEKKNEIEIEMKNFVKSWNKLAQQKYQLRHQCHDLGSLEKIDKNSSLNNFLLDKESLDNIEGRKLISFITISANEYNDICRIVQNNVKAAYSQKTNMQLFSSININPTILDKQSKMLQFPIQVLKDQIFRYSSYSVEYGISYPYYAFDQIQSMIIKELYGCKYLISDPEKFCYISFIGEQSHFITDLRDHQMQYTLQQSGLKPRFIQYIKNLKEQPETFYKTIKGIQRSLQNIVIFFKNFKNKSSMHQMTIRNFVNQNKIKGMSKQIFQEPIQSLQLANISDFYQMIQYLTFEKVQALLDSDYKKEMQMNEKQEFIDLLKSMKRQNREPEIPPYRDFKIAFYRIAGRNLLLRLTDQKKSISLQLNYIEAYWPKGTNLEIFQRGDHPFTDFLGRITISKIGDMLNLMPFKQKDLFNDEQINERPINDINMNSRIKENILSIDQSFTQRNQRAQRGNRTQIY